MISDRKALAAGLARIAASIDDEVRRTLSVRHDELESQTKLKRALTFDSPLFDQVSKYVHEELETGGEDAVDTLRPIRTQLSLLHKSISALNAAVSWANQYTAISWWIGTRLEALGLKQFTVILSPGPVGDFRIATPNASQELARLAKKDVVIGVSENIELLAQIRILHVPSSDGSSALWHPLILGHELAHLRYDFGWAEEWLADQDSASVSGDLAKDAITLATNRATEVPSGWYQSLALWLSEIACDTSLRHQYGIEGLACLETHLSIHALAEDSSTHPSPLLRLAIQSAAHQEDLAKFRPTVPTQDEKTRRRSTCISFALACREQVRAELATELGGADAASDDASEAAFDALADQRTPESQVWPAAILAKSPSSIESGLVRALWRRQSMMLSGDAGDVPIQEMVLRAIQDLDRVEHAVDSLQFASRFERSRISAETARTDRICNVLWVTKQGVKLSPQDAGGAASQDLRLGRHFVIFKRNEISSLNSLGELSSVKGMQSTVEVGWGQQFVLHPGELVLAVTFESLRVSADCSAQVLSRSSLGRMGLLSATAVQVQPGFHGCLTLELVNLASVPLNLVPGQRIAQVVPLPSLGRKETYAGHYADAGPRPRFSAAHRDWESEILRNL